MLYKMIRIREIRESILNVASQFRSESTNFRSEGNFQCLLFSQLREFTKKCTVSGIELVHAELPTNPSIEHVGFHDLAVLTRASARHFKEYYGRPVHEWRKMMQMFATFEIKFFSV